MIQARERGGLELDDKDKKQVPLRLTASLWKELTEWAEDDFRSLNGQIEYLLSESVRQRKKRKSTETNGSDE